ncbi:MAG: DUF5320 domain-containing protein [Spirochaetales bacterium]|nr:DUF5320 domain-containing protein [Spirochaetales bacterium]
MRRDGTGPRGMGARTGRGWGSCPPVDEREALNSGAWGRTGQGFGPRNDLGEGQGFGPQGHRRWGAGPGGFGPGYGRGHGRRGGWNGASFGPGRGQGFGRGFGRRGGFGAGPWGGCFAPAGWGGGAFVHPLFPFPEESKKQSTEEDDS